MATSPASVRLPGRVAEVASSNSSEYALLANGSVYAWGLGNAGQLGDGATKDSFTKPVRVRFPARVKIASLPIDVMPFDTGLAVDTTGHVWGWGDNQGGELCLGNRQKHLTPVRLPFSHVTAVPARSTMRSTTREARSGRAASTASENSATGPPSPARCRSR